MTRDRSVRLLLASRFDGLWFPPAALRTSSGLVPAQVQPCATCGGMELWDDFGKVILRRKGRGVVKDRFGRTETCGTCRGAGRVARDPMAPLSAVGSTATAASARPRRTVRCDACDGDGVVRGERCRYCDGMGRRELHVFDLQLELMAEPDVDAVAAAIERRDRAGSYHELDLLLETLRARSLRVWRATVSLVDPLAIVGVTWIAPRMPSRIRVPADIRANDRIVAERRTRARGRGQAIGLRDREIRRHLNDGRSVQWVAVEYGLSVSSVYRVADAGRRAA